MEMSQKEQLLRIELKKREFRSGRRESRPGSLSLAALRKEAEELFREQYPSTVCATAAE